MVNTLLNPLFQYLVVLTREGKEMKHGNNALIFSSAVVLVLSGVTSPVYAGTTESQDFDEIVSSAGLDFAVVFIKLFGQFVEAFGSCVG